MHNCFWPWARGEVVPSKNAETLGLSFWQVMGQRS